MKALLREIRLLLFVTLIGLAMRVLPKDCPETFSWISKMPFQK